MEAACVYFTPELARIVAQQIHVLGRLVPNFTMASVGKPMAQVETWEAFRPGRPVLYPSAAQFRDLSEADATSLINFYDSVHGIAETINTWIETKTPQDVNSWNVLMQTVDNSLKVGEIAVQRFCPERWLSPIAPASGTLIQNIERTNPMVQKALAAHLSRSDDLKFAAEFERLSNLPPKHPQSRSRSQMVAWPRPSPSASDGGALRSPRADRVYRRAWRTVRACRRRSRRDAGG